MHDMRVLTVQEIRDIMTLLGQDNQDLIDRLASLTGENARRMRSRLKTDGDAAGLMHLVGASAGAENTT